MTTSSIFRMAVSAVASLSLVLSSFAILIVPAAQAAANWDTSGSYTANFNYIGTDYSHDITLTQDGDGNLSGSGSSGAYAWTITSGTVDGDTIEFDADYTATNDAVTPQTTMHVEGNIAGDGSMSGTWSDNYQGNERSGTWHTTSGEASKLETQPDAVTVTIAKYVDGKHATGESADNATFSFIADYDGVIIGMGQRAGSDPYDIGPVGNMTDNAYEAVTREFEPGADYGTHEVMNDMVGASCEDGKPFALTGYTWGDSMEEAQDAEPSMTPPAFTDLQGNKYVIVWNDDCSTDENPNPTAETISVNGDTAAAENQEGWMFNRDTSTQTPFSFQTGNASIGTGSLYVPPITNTVNGNSDKFIGELFLLKPISGINSISYDFKIASSGEMADKDQFYMNVYANFGESAPTNFYDCRYDVVPTTGVVDGYTTVIFDPTLTYPVTTRGSSPHACPASPSGMDALDVGSPVIRMISISAGDTSGSDTGVSGYFDNVVVDTDSVTTTYDFEPADATQEPGTNTVTIVKYVNGMAASTTNATSSFPMSATWAADNIGAGSGSYELDADGFNGDPTPYQAVTSPMSDGASYSTNEDLSGPTVGASCSEQKPYMLSGYSTGDTLMAAAAAATSTAMPMFSNLQNDKYVIVWNMTCNATSTATTTDAGLHVDSINAQKTNGSADNTYENGWRYVFRITAPTNEENLSMKFSDWTGQNASNTIPVANNMRVSSAQASNPGPITLTAANAYSTPPFVMTGDLDPVAPGRQVDVVVELKIPAGTANDSYTTTYGVQTLP